MQQAVPVVATCASRIGVRIFLVLGPVASLRSLDVSCRRNDDEGTADPRAIEDPNLFPPVINDVSRSRRVNQAIWTRS